jgi:hypothetical protein
MKVLVYNKRLFLRVKLVGANGETLMVSEADCSRSNTQQQARQGECRAFLG